VIDKYFKNLRYFYRALGGRLVLSVVLNIIVGVLDGLGLAMFLPLLQMVSGNQDDWSEKETLVGQFFEHLSLPLNLYTVVAIMVIVFALKGVMKFLSNAYQVMLIQRVIRTIRISLFEKFHGLDYKYYSGTEAGSTQNSLTMEVSRVGLSCRSYLKTMESTVLVITYLVMAFLTNPQFTVLVTVAALLTNFVYKFINKRTKGQSRNLVTKNSTYQGMVLEYINQYKYLKVSGKIQLFGERLKKGILGVEETNKRIGVLNAIALSVREPLLILVLCTVMIIQVELLEGSLALILLSIVFFYRAMQAVLALQNQYNVFLSAEGSLHNLQQLEEEFDSHQLKFGHVNYEGLTHEILVENVVFGFNDEPVLKGVSLHIRKNETVAFVGPSGSGKTTLINIISGLLAVDEGIVRYDDRSILDYDLNALQRHIGYITQEAIVFNDTLFNNITLWDEPNADNLQRFEQALKDSALMDTIDLTSADEDAVLGNNGISLSGGQRQRVSIARELYKDPDILIMDEATSSLDSSTEAVIQEKINDFRGKKTILIVAHRLSTIKDVDRVIYLEAGRIKASGSYAELVSTVPEFEKMVELQNLQP
jgi:subfamily B ATP-binding cassette protein MsbA